MPNKIDRNNPIKNDKLNILEKIQLNTIVRKISNTATPLSPITPLPIRKECIPLFGSPNIFLYLQKFIVFFEI